MKPRSAVICAIVAFAICGHPAPAQFPGCAYIVLFNPCPLNIEAQGDCEPIIDPQEACQGCQPGAAAWWVVNDRRDGEGEVKVTIRVRLWDVLTDNSTFTDQVLTLAAGERRKLGCSQPTAHTRYTWSVEDCQPRSPHLKVKLYDLEQELNRLKPSGDLDAEAVKFLQILAQQPGLRIEQIAGYLGVTKVRAEYHRDNLMGADMIGYHGGIVEMDYEGYELRRNGREYLAQHGHI